MAISSYRSQAWMTSWRVGGTRTRKSSSACDVTRHMRDNSDANFEPLSLRKYKKKLQLFFHFIIVNHPHPPSPTFVNRSHIWARSFSDLIKKIEIVIKYLPNSNIFVSFFNIYCFFSVL